MRLAADAVTRARDPSAASAATLTSAPTWVGLLLLLTTRTTGALEYTRTADAFE